MGAADDTHEDHPRYDMRRFDVGRRLAFAQGGLMPNLPDREVIAAQDALEEAMAHLQNARNPSSPAVTRAKAYIALAHTELGPTGGAQGLQLNPE